VIQRRQDRKDYALKKNISHLNFSKISRGEIMKKLLQHILEQKEITKSPLIGMRGKHEDLFYTFSLDTAAEAKEVINKLLTIKHEIDLVPICLGDIDDFNFLIQHLADHSLQEANSIIRSAFSLDLENWKRERALAVLEDLFAPRQYPSKVLSGLDFPSLIPPDGPIFVGLVPGKRSWVAPAFVDVGGTNDYPPSMVTCRILRNFEDRLFQISCLCDQKESNRACHRSSSD
jgi:hypothetical protein